MLMHPDDMKLKFNLAQPTKRTSFERLSTGTLERKRYPQYDHTAVIIAENITSRFFNGVIPLVAMQMSVIKVGPNISLMFVPVLDQLNLGLVDEDEEVQ